MATVAEIEDGIRRLYAKDPKDPRIKILGEARAKLLAGGDATAPAKEKGYLESAGDYIAGTYNNMTDPQQWKDAVWRGTHDSQGRNIGEQLMDPFAGPKAALDQAAIAGDDLSFGLYPRLTGQTEAVAAARERAGTAGTGMDMATAAAIPSRTAQAVAGPLTKAAGYGLEGAALSGLRPVLEGADQRDVLAAMATGGLLSGAGSIGARYLPGGSERNTLRKAPYPDDPSLFKESARTPRNTVEGKDLATRTEKVKDLRIAATKGRPGLRELDRKQIDANTAARGYKTKEPYPYEERLKVSEAAHGTPSKGFLGGTADFAGSVLRAGGLPLSWLTKGLSAFGAAGLEKGVQAALSKGGRRQVDEIADYIRNNGLGRMPTSVSPELADRLRDYVATSMRTGGSRK